MNVHEINDALRVEPWYCDQSLKYVMAAKATLDSARDAGWKWHRTSANGWHIEPPGGGWKIVPPPPGSAIGHEEAVQESTP